MERVDPHSNKARPIGIGIVGLSARGGWAALAHAPAIENVPGVELRALTASSPESAAQAGKRFAVPHHTDAAALAHDPDVDLVVIAVKVSKHKDLIESALAAGKMVLCEWPLGNGSTEARQLTEQASTLGIRTFVGMQARATPAIRYLRDLIREGYVGEVLSTTLTASGVSWGDLTFPEKTYLLDREEGASLLTIPAAHTLDAVQYVLGDFATIQATTAIRRKQVRMHRRPDELHLKTVADQIAVQGVLDSGAVVATHFRGGTSRGTDFHWEINGTKGDIIVRGDGYAGAFLQYGQVHLVGARGDESELTSLPTPDKYIKLTSLPEHGSHAFTVAHAYAQIVDDVAHGTSVVPDFSHALSLHHFIDSIEESAERGVRVEL
ncbi:oxidoreductase [Rhodococcus sp. ACS1]|uniref:Gfo/Idh/MocA family protein n=1 Tax=Rhodococcus sp. ACS1 TaxID=2028570 RepID=UPI000BB119DE|nr:Gfo/Idh/MocA family oxidoreductase [Rhodococcus sp. ACS1]PBC35346.1 oxidoreductase [Rhodococcus sp. ACS1]